MVWQWDSPVAALSSAPVGGGVSQPAWLINIGVHKEYSRMDLAEHAAEIAAEHRLVGDGMALFTAANIESFQRGSCDGVVAHVTVGISKPTWAADPAGGYTLWSPGTINTVVQLPVGLEMSAAVNAVMTATEAKTQALLEASVPGTGTASDAVVIVWPVEAPTEPFGGPRSPWGARIAQAAHAAVQSGLPS